MNLTDGLDGLAAGSSTFCFACLAIIGYWQYRHFGIYRVPDALDLALAAVALAGACLGFLWWNAAPAKIFMGDTGSLSIGSGLAALCLLMNLDLLLVVIGGLFVIVTLSVVIQIVSFRVFHRRVFRMAPLHHHFELLGWPETTVIVRFWILAGLFAALGPRHLLRGLPHRGEGLMGFHHPNAPVGEARRMQIMASATPTPRSGRLTRRGPAWLNATRRPGDGPRGRHPSTAPPGRVPVPRVAPSGDPARPVPGRRRLRRWRPGQGDPPVQSGRSRCPAIGTAPAIAVLIAVLCVFGLIMVGSASPLISIQLYGSPWSIFDPPGPVDGVGHRGVLVFLEVDYRKWRRVRGPLVVVTIGSCWSWCSCPTWACPPAVRRGGSGSACCSCSPPS